MKAMRTLICSLGLIAGVAGIARADDAADPATYKQKMHDCTTQMKTDKPDMNHEARRKACRKQLGPAPKTHAGSPPATSTPPGTPPSSSPVPQANP